MGPATDTTSRVLWLLVNFCMLLRKRNILPLSDGFKHSTPFMPLKRTCEAASETKHVLRKLVHSQKMMTIEARN